MLNIISDKRGVKQLCGISVVCYNVCGFAKKKFSNVSLEVKMNVFLNTLPKLAI